ncbi:MAG: hypothetical protein LRY55_15290 [Leadbetterella sp.]|nr:hypothetical protein [Leadbetterella sp.]
MQKAIEIQEKYGNDPEYSDNPFLKSNPRNIFESPASVLEGLNKFSLVEMGSKPFFNSTSTIQYNIQQQPNFNKDFNLLIAHLKNQEKNKAHSFLFAENAKQIERFYNIFSDLKADVKLFPINRAVHAGFMDSDLGVGIYTDHQIFNRYHKYKIKQGYSKDRALILKTLNELQPGDFVTVVKFKEV